jgi:hypothetical protein
MTDGGRQKIDDEPLLAKLKEKGPPKTLCKNLPRRETGQQTPLGRERQKLLHTPDAIAMRQAIEADIILEPVNTYRSSCDSKSAQSLSSARSPGSLSLGKDSARARNSARSRDHSRSVRAADKDTVLRPVSSPSVLGPVDHPLKDRPGLGDFYGLASTSRGVEGTGNSKLSSPASGSDEVARHGAGGGNLVRDWAQNDGVDIEGIRTQVQPCYMFVAALLHAFAT